MRLPLAVSRARFLVHQTQTRKRRALFGSIVTTFCVLSVGSSAAAGAAKTTATTLGKPAKTPSTVVVAAPASNAAGPTSSPGPTVLSSNRQAGLGAPVPASKPTTDLKGDIEAKIASVQREAAPTLKIGAVSCPATLAGKKAKVPVGNYSCTITIEGVPAPYTVIVKEGGSLKGGVFQIFPAKAIIDVSKIVTFVKTSLDPADAAATKISCGKATVVVADPGTPILCSLTRGKAVEKLEFEVRNVNGLVALKTGAKPAAPSTIPAVVAASSTAVVVVPTTVVPKA